MDRLPIGKVDPRILAEKVFTRLGAYRSEVVQGPRIGGDAAALRVGGGLVVVKSDPIVGAQSRIGRLAVDIVTNDLACLGAEPLALMMVILLPEGSTVEDLETIASEAHEEAEKLNVAIVGGHTEVVVGMKGRPPIVVASGIGVPVGKRIVPSDGARPGDLILMTKYAGVEGTAILAEDFQDRLSKRVPSRIVESARRFHDMTTVIKEALELARRGIPHAMHDPTDGGLLEGLYEMAEAAGVGFIVWEEKVPVARETVEISRVLGIDPLKLISSGTLLAAIPEDKSAEALTLLEKIGVNAAIIGRFTERSEGKIIIRKTGDIETVDEPVLDELWRLYSETTIE